MKWNNEQDRALVEASRWMNDSAAPQVFYLGGYAGTGKTTLAKHLVDGQNWLYAAYTGKAAHVMREKGCHGASTIHSLIYRPAGGSKEQELLQIAQRIRILTEKEEPSAEDVKQIAYLQKVQRQLEDDKKLRFQLWADSPLASPGVRGIVVDEVSMVDEQLGKDLESFGKKILVLGDPAQLPPVKARGYYTRGTPDILLTEVHRQAQESGILRLATIIRQGGYLEDFESTDDCEIIRQSEISKDDLAMEVLSADQTLCGLNASRHAMNKRHRELLGYSEEPQKSDRLVCLSNNREYGIFNGSQWLVLEAECDGAFGELYLLADFGIRKIRVNALIDNLVNIPPDPFVIRRDFAEFDWSYALTVHKAQGSQWKSVVLFDQSRTFRQDARKWLYTGITRASKKLTVVI